MLSRPLLLLLVLLAPAAGPAAWAQEESRAETESRLRELEEQIQQDQTLLSETQAAEQASLEALNGIDRQIKLREELVGAYRLRLDELSRERDTLRVTLERLERDLSELKAQYVARAQHAYKYGRLHDLALVLSASSVNQMLVRVRYLTRFADQRRAKLDEIKSAEARLEARRAELEAATAKTQTLLAQSEQEQDKLSALRSERQQIIQQLRTQRADLERALARKQSAASELERQIEALIAAETARSVGRSPEEAAAYAALSGSFLDNLGRIPWPASGVVTESFGNVTNPVYGTVTFNPGLLIATQPSAEVRAVFDGEVIGIDVMPEYGTYVTIAHGAYKTVYSNFSMLYVAEGMQVEAGQVIGRAGTKAQPKGNGLFFALFEKGKAVDPERWLR